MTVRRLDSTSATCFGASTFIIGPETWLSWIRILLVSRNFLIRRNIISSRKDAVLPSYLHALQTGTLIVIFCPTGPGNCSGQKWQSAVIPRHTTGVLRIGGSSSGTDGGYAEGHRSWHTGAPYVQSGVGGRRPFSAGYGGYRCSATEGSSGQRSERHLQTAGSSLWRCTAHWHYGHDQGNAIAAAHIVYSFLSVMTQRFLNCVIKSLHARPHIVFLMVFMSMNMKRLLTCGLRI